MMNSKLTKINVEVPKSEYQLKFQLINNENNNTVMSQVINSNLEEIKLDSYQLATHYNYTYSFYEKNGIHGKLYLRKKYFQ